MPRSYYTGPLERALEYLDRAMAELGRVEVELDASSCSAVSRILAAQAVAVASDATRAVQADLSPASAPRLFAVADAPF